MAKQKRSRLLDLPYVLARKEGLFVRITYPVGQGKYKAREEKLPADATPDDAIAVIARLQQTVKTNPLAFEGERMSFATLLAQFRVDNPKMPDWYAAPLAEFFGAMRIRTINFGIVKQFRQAREQVTRLIPNPDNPTEKIAVARKPATINRELEWLRAVLLYAVRRGWLEKNPLTSPLRGETLIEKGAEDQRARVPTPEEEARLLAACTGRRAHLRGLIIATRDTGLRRSALRALTWPDVDWEQRALRVPPPKSKYKRRPKVIALTQRLHDELLRLWHEAKQPTEGLIFGHSDFKRSYATACRLAGVVGLRFNDLRHGFATDMLEANVSERLAMKAAGHNNPETHAIYANFDLRLSRQVADALDALHKQREQQTEPAPKL